MVSIDGQPYSGIDLSFLDPLIHAIQWYDVFGEVEWMDAFGKITENQTIDSFTPYDAVIPLWEQAKAQWEIDHPPLPPLVK